MFKKLILITLVTLLSGCATPYRSAGLMGGYSDMQLNDDTYKVSFRGNGYSSHEHVQNMLLRRCAELTRNKGYKYFVILASDAERKDDQFSTPATISTQSTGFGSGYFSGNNYGSSYGGHFNTFGSSSSNTVINPGQTYNTSRYKDTTTIKMFQNNNKAPGAFKAETVLANFGAS